MRRIIAVLSLCLLAAPAAAQWRDPQGNFLPNAPDRAQVDGFGGMLLVTPDADWAEKWNTPPETRPSFNSTTTVAVGDTVTVLTFFGGSGADEAGLTHIRCDMRVTRPDGSTSVDVKDAECARGQAVDAKYIQLLGPHLQLVAEPGDLRGPWRIDVTLRDVTRNLTVPLTTQVTLTDAKSPPTSGE